jgi:hypothetical protein
VNGEAGEERAACQVSLHLRVSFIEGKSAHPITGFGHQPQDIGMLVGHLPDTTQRPPGTSMSLCTGALWVKGAKLPLLP